MLSDRKSSALQAVLASMAALFAMYGGAYYLTVQPSLNEGPGEAVVPMYRGLPRRINRVFDPMHWLDRRIRPRAWVSWL